MSLASCYGSALALLLRKNGRVVSGLQIQAAGLRKAEHPAGFTVINIGFSLQSDAKNPEVGKVLALAKAKFCPAYAVLTGNV